MNLEVIPENLKKFKKRMNELKEKEGDPRAFHFRDVLELSDLPKEEEVPRGPNGTWSDEQVMRRFRAEQGKGGGNSRA